MKQTVLRLRRLDWFSWLIVFFFIIFTIGNLIYIEADTDPFFLTTEEKSSTDAAKSLLVSGTLDTGGNYYQTIRIMPLANLFAYPIFRVFGLGFAQARLPYALLTIVFTILFYLLLKKIFGRSLAFLGTMLFALYPDLMMVGRTSLNENLFVFLMIATLYLFYLLYKGNKKWFISFILGLVIGLNVLVKINGFAIAGFSIFYIFIWFLITKKFNKKEKINLLSFLLAGFIICLIVKQLIIFWANKELGNLGVGVEQYALSFFNPDPLGVFLSWLKDPLFFIKNILPAFIKSQSSFYYTIMTSIAVILAVFLFRRRRLNSYDYFIIFILFLNIIFIGLFKQQGSIKRIIVTGPLFIYFIIRAVSLCNSKLQIIKDNKKSIIGLILALFIVILSLFSIFESIKTNQKLIYKPSKNLAFDSQQVAERFKVFWGERDYQLWGDEQSQRILVYSTPVRFNFYEDCTQTNWDKIFSEIIEKKEIRFFVFNMYHQSNDEREEKMLKNLKVNYPNIKIVEQFVSTWRKRPLEYILFDKYPD